MPNQVAQYRGCKSERLKEGICVMALISIFWCEFARIPLNEVNKLFTLLNRLLRQFHEKTNWRRVSA